MKKLTATSASVVIVLFAVLVEARDEYQILRSKYAPDIRADFNYSQGSEEEDVPAARIVSLHILLVSLHIS